MIPHRAAGAEETGLPPDCQRILAAVRQAAKPVTARRVGEMTGVDVRVRAELEPLRGKLIRLVERGWLRKLPRPCRPPRPDWPGCGLRSAES